MRTAPVALAYLDDEAALVEAARAVSELTHYDPDAGDACVLWCTAIRHAILTGKLDVRIGLGHIDIDRRDLWASRLDEAETSQPSAFAAKNGWVVAALQAAWSAIVTTPVPVEDPAVGGVPCRPPAAGAGGRGARRRRHRHRRGDRGRPARRRVRRIGGALALAVGVCRAGRA